MTHFGRGFQGMRHHNQVIPLDRNVRRKIRRATRDLAAARENLPDLDFTFGMSAQLFMLLGVATEIEARSRKYFDAAEMCMEELCRCRPSERESWCNCGLLVLQNADRLPDFCKATLLDRAIGRLKNAHKFSAPDRDPEVPYALSACLLLQAQLEDPELATMLRREAERYADEAEGILIGAGAYNLACVAAHQGNEDACEHWLQIAVDQRNPPNAQMYFEDPDLKTYASADWFHTCVSTLEQ